MLEGMICLPASPELFFPCCHTSGWTRRRLQSLVTQGSKRGDAWYGYRWLFPNPSMGWDFLPVSVLALAWVGRRWVSPRKALLPLSPCTVTEQKALLSRDLPLCFAPAALWQKYFSSHAGTAKFTLSPTSGQFWFSNGLASLRRMARCAEDHSVAAWAEGDSWDVCSPVGCE